jgi:methylation protein EvaC
MQAKKNKIKTFNNFFNKKTVYLIKNFYHKTDVIYGANVICHIPDIDNLIKTLDILLNRNGLFIFEEPYLGSMFNKVSYDQIYDEHIYIFSASSVMKIFQMYDFELIDVLPQNTHGGSMRYVISRKNNRSKSSRLKKILDYEKIKNLDNIESCREFKKSCEESKIKIKSKLIDLKNKNLKICGYGATSKSTTILNYCNIGPELIDCIYDTTKDKINKFSPGMHIPIIDMNNLKKNYPDVLYLFAWNHKNEIFRKEKKFLKKGGKWISHVNF